MPTLPRTPAWRYNELGVPLDERALLPLLAAGVLYPLNFVLHPIDSVILMTLFVAWLLSGTARLNSFDPKPASQSEPQKEPAE